MDYRILFNLDPSHRTVRQGLRNPATLGPVVDAYAQNVERMGKLMSLPVSLITHAASVQLATDIAEYQVLGTLTDVVITDPAARREIHAVAAKMHEEWGAEAMTVRGQSHGLNVGSAVIRNIMTDVSGTGTAVGIRTLLDSVLIAAWTAFETLAGDLWEAAERTYPGGTFAMTGDRRRIGDIAAGARGLTAATGPSRLRRDRARLASLTTIREAYSAAFDRNSNDIDAVLGNTALDALSTVRNVLIHSGGVADARYVGLLTGLPAAAPVVGVGTHVHLDGRSAFDLINPMLPLGTRLIVAVDQWT